eukprot:TRINITY_DN11830_c0_g1_i1.p1 TRINITY_DN11830_c0_g1~~TRINITY_DN11830_c0_g1_i1.p1  ORF type:complete len:129 (+),score=10.48 TRINITY_DN11830_c0_g1_i1:165-551(+)
MSLYSKMRRSSLDSSDFDEFIVSSRYSAKDPSSQIKGMLSRALSLKDKRFFESSSSPISRRAFSMRRSNLPSSLAEGELCRRSGSCRYSRISPDFQEEERTEKKKKRGASVFRTCKRLLGMQSNTNRS